MRHEDILKNCLEHKHALIFAAGIATTLIGAKVVKSQAFKDTATKGMATIMAVKKDAEECFQDMKENAEDIVVDSNAEVKKEIYVESEE
ncbi:hypothetical protein [Methanobrevibacter sp.]